MEFNATFLVSAISFIVFTLIMNAIFYKPLSKVVQERQKFIDDTNEEARLHKEKSEAILTDKEVKLEQSKTNAKKIILEKTETVKAQKTTLTTEAQQKAANNIELAKDDLHKSTDKAEEVLAEEAKKLAEDISSKILGNK